MDGPRFDDLTRRLAAGSVSRRRLVRGGLAAIAASLGFSEARAATNKRSAGNACRLDSDCLSNICLPQGRTRKICACIAPADCPQPAAPCLDATCVAGVCNIASDAGQNGQLCGAGGQVCQNGTCACPNGLLDCGGVCQSCCSPADCPEPICSTATCVDGACGLSPIAGCCTADDQCDDGLICTIDACNLTTNTCIHTPAADNLACGSGQACCGGVCTDVTSTSNCGACGTTCEIGIPCVNEACGCPQGQAPCNGACVTNCAAGFVFDAQCACVCPSGTKRCQNICISESACCTDADCTEAGDCQSAACEYNPRTFLPPGRCVYNPIPDCCTANVNHCQARDLCDPVTCDTGANTCVHGIKSCPGCFACNLNDGSCTFDECRGNNPCQYCDGTQCVADTSLNLQRGGCPESVLFCFNGDCVGCVGVGTECNPDKADQCCTGFCTINPNGQFGSYICSCEFPTESCSFNGQCCSNCCSGGFCADLTEDLNNCGACGVHAPAGGICDSGNPTCTLGFHNDNGRCCAVGESNCGSYCANLSIDPLNCGSCGVHVPIGGICSGGQSQCLSGFHEDNGRCCAAGSHNAGDQCCVNGFDSCGGICVSVTTDPLNCGSCGNHCPINNVLCVNGHCCNGFNC